MDTGTLIGYAAAFFVGLIAGRLWGAATARGGNMIAPLTGSSVDDPALVEEVRRVAGAGNLIQAIKLYRERTGSGLKEAKDAVERICGL